MKKLKTVTLNGEYTTIANVSEFYGWPEITIRSWILRGKLKATKMSERSVIINEDDIGAFIQEYMPIKKGRPKH